jgi:hypothetical protein
MIIEECGVKEDVVTKIEKNMLEWFGHVERMDERRLMRRIWVVILEGEDLGERFLIQIGQVLVKGQVKSTRNRRACMRILMKVEKAKGVCKDRSKWEEVISAYPYRKRL